MSWYWVVLVVLTWAGTLYLMAKIAQQYGHTQGYFDRVRDESARYYRDHPEAREKL